MGEFGFWHVFLSVELPVLKDQSSTSSRHAMQYTEVNVVHVHKPIHTFHVCVHGNTHTDMHMHTYTITVHACVPSSHKHCSAT